MAMLGDDRAGEVFTEDPEERKIALGLYTCFGRKICAQMSLGKQIREEGQELCLRHCASQDNCRRSPAKLMTI